MTAPDKDGKFWAIDQWQGGRAQLHEYNVANYHGQPGNNFQILTDEKTGEVTRSLQMIVDAQQLAKRSENHEVTAATNNTLHEMGRTPDAQNNRSDLGAAAQSPVVSDDHVLKEHATGAAVFKLQGELAELGYKNHHGQLLPADKVFGIDTRHAVEKFQHDHALLVDGKVGPMTEKAIDAAMREHVEGAEKVPALTDPRNPDHPLYDQALIQVHKLDASRGRTSDHMSENLAGALTVAAKTEGLKSIDHVLLSDDGKRAFAVQGSLDSPLKQIAHVETAQAVNTQLAQSAHAATLTSRQPEQPAVQTQNQQATPTQTYGR